MFHPSPVDEIVLLGMGPSVAKWMQQVYNEMKTGVEGRQVWGVNTAGLCWRVDCIFSMHTEAVVAGHFPVDREAEELLKTNALDPEGLLQAQAQAGAFANLHKEYLKTGATVVTLDGAPGTLEYPLAEVIEVFGSPYLVLGPAYMVALAMLARPKRICVFGMDFDYGTLRGAYEAGRPCMEYWLGRATQMGIEVVAPTMSNILSLKQLKKKGLYGYGYQQPVFEAVDGKLVLAGFSTLPPRFSDATDHLP